MATGVNHVVALFTSDPFFVFFPPSSFSSPCHLHLAFTPTRVGEADRSPRLAFCSGEFTSPSSLS